MVKWVDDFFVIRLPNQSWNQTDFMDYTSKFGVPWSMRKLRPLNVIQRYIGFDWDLPNARLDAGFFSFQNCFQAMILIPHHSYSVSAQSYIFFVSYCTEMKAK